MDVMLLSKLKLPSCKLKLLSYEYWLKDFIDYLNLRIRINNIEE